MFEKDPLRLTAVAWTLYFLSDVFFPESWLPSVLLLASLVVSAAALISRVRTRRASQSWPSILGSVEFTSVLDNPQRTVIFYPHVLHIAYSSMAEGQRYSGFYEQRFRREFDAETLAGTLKATGVMVRYNPRLPDQSVLHIEPAR
jgi:hypothetical protein